MKNTAVLAFSLSLAGSTWLRTTRSDHSRRISQRCQAKQPIEHRAETARTLIPSSDFLRVAKTSDS
jgi:hypothetical protein